MTSLAVRVRRRMQQAVHQLRVDPRGVGVRLVLRVRMGVLSLRSRWVPTAVVGDAPVVVCLTTFGRRAATAHYTIESIGRGADRPRRLVLWVDDEDVLADLPVALRRLRRRGLEILRCPDYGPHNKQYPYAASTARHELPLVTADDDMLYPRDWLRRLLVAHRKDPQVIHCFRAHEVQVRDGRITPYDDWPPRLGTAASLKTFATGVSGVIYPPAFLDRLREEGEAFLATAPRADDVWIHAMAVRHGFPARQLGTHPAHFWPVLGTQTGTLQRHNVTEGGNDVQIGRAYGPQETARLAATSGAPR